MTKPMTAEQVRSKLGDDHIEELEGLREICDTVPWGHSFLMKFWRNEQPVKSLVDLGCIDWGFKGKFSGNLKSVRITAIGRGVLALVSAGELVRIKQAAQERFSDEDHSQ